MKSIYEQVMALDKLPGPWYTEYFAVGPLVRNLENDTHITPDDVDIETFESMANDTAGYELYPCIFGPNATRQHSINTFNTFSEALQNVIDNLGHDSGYYASNIADLVNENLVNKIISGNSLTFITDTYSGVQDLYGCFMRVSRKPFKTNKSLGLHYALKASKAYGFDLGDLLDMGIVGDSYKEQPNFMHNEWAWQGN